MKKLKKILIITATCILIYALYVTADCIRLSKSEFDTKPIICIREQKIDYDNKASTKYIGLGYTVEYYYYLNTPYDENINVISGKGAECRFSDALVWAWIE